MKLFGQFVFRSAVALALSLVPQSTWGQEPGWMHSPLPGEGDRAAMGCDRDASDDDHACLAVRCEEDFTVGIYVHSSRPGGDVGVWEMTIDRETISPEAEPTDAPYGGRFAADAEGLLERLKQGTFVYLRHASDKEGAFRFISLSGSLRSIGNALYYCAPRVPPEDGRVRPPGSAASAAPSAHR